MKNFNSYNPQYRRYPYIRQPVHRFYGEFADCTLLSPLFQSIAEYGSLYDCVMKTGFPPEVTHRWQQKAIAGELTCMGIGGIADFNYYQLIEIQNNSASLILTSKTTGEILEVIDLSEENLNRRIEEFLPADHRCNTFRDETVALTVA